MADVGLVPFVRFFPEQAAAETRVLTVRGHPALPDDAYALFEAYCADAKCDCRRVMLNVVSQRQQRQVATISYGFDRDKEMAGPFLDPINPQSEYAEVLLSLVKEVLASPDYVARLERHYHQAKLAAADPDHPIQALLARMAQEEQEETRALERRHGILGGSDAGPESHEAGKRRRGSQAGGTGTSSAQPREESVPKRLRPLFEAIVGMTDLACKEHLDGEYAQLCRELTAALCRKRPSPLTHGRVETWACGIVYVIGSVNFLFDKSQTPYLSAGDLCQLFGVGKSAGSAKARAIAKMLRIGAFDPRWYRPSQLGSNPLAWMVEVNGFIVDARHESREFQEEAFRRGLIPYVP